MDFVLLRVGMMMGDNSQQQVGPRSGVFFLCVCVRTALLLNILLRPKQINKFVYCILTNPGKRPKNSFINLDHSMRKQKVTYLPFFGACYSKLRIICFGLNILELLNNESSYGTKQEVALPS